MKIEPWQRIAAQTKGPGWYGDLEDDCSAQWAGLILRAEMMYDKAWWWAVSDEASGEEVDSSNNHEQPQPTSGVAARQLAEAAVYEWLGVTRQVLCDECGSLFYGQTSQMDAICPECAHYLYGYENCAHEIVDGRCTRCCWDGSCSALIRELKDARANDPPDQSGV